MFSDQFIDGMKHTFFHVEEPTTPFPSTAPSVSPTAQPTERLVVDTTASFPAVLVSNPTEVADTVKDAILNHVDPSTDEDDIRVTTEYKTTFSVTFK